MQAITHGTDKQGLTLQHTELYSVSKDKLKRKRIFKNVYTGMKTAGRNINNLRYADDTTLMAESEELKSLLMNVKEDTEKVFLKLNIQKTKIMASGPITLWQIDGKQRK